MLPCCGMAGGPLSSLNQLLFSIRSVIFSLEQAMQIVSMSAQGLRQLLESATGMFDHVVETQPSKHERSVRNRPRIAPSLAMRMALVAGILCLGHRLVRQLLFPLRRQQQHAAIGCGQGTMWVALHPQVVRQAQCRVDDVLGVLAFKNKCQNSLVFSVKLLFRETTSLRKFLHRARQGQCAPHRGSHAHTTQRSNAERLFDPHVALTFVRVVLLSLCVCVALFRLFFLLPRVWLFEGKAGTSRHRQHKSR